MLNEAMAARQILIERVSRAMAKKWAAEPEILVEMAQRGFKGFAKMDNASILLAAREVGLMVDDVAEAMQPTSTARAALDTQEVDADGRRRSP